MNSAWTGLSAALRDEAFRYVSETPTSNQQCLISLSSADTHSALRSSEQREWTWSQMFRQPSFNSNILQIVFVTEDKDVSRVRTLIEGIPAAIPPLPPHRPPSPPNDFKLNRGNTFACACNCICQSRPERKTCGRSFTPNVFGRHLLGKKTPKLPKLFLYRTTSQGNAPLRRNFVIVACQLDGRPARVANRR